jgi:hypothetical protein
MMNQVQSKRTVVDVDTRRSVAMVARARKPRDVAAVNHETFIRNTLKDRMGWPRREPAPETIKSAAKEMAAALVKRDQELAADKAAAEKAAKEVAEAAL